MTEQCLSLVLGVPVCCSQVFGAGACPPSLLSWQPFGATLSVWQMSLCVTDGSENLTEDQSSWLKPNKHLLYVCWWVLPVLKLFPVV